MVRNDCYATVVRDGKSKGGMIPSAHLGAMLQAEIFLRQFPHVDLVTMVSVPGGGVGAASPRIHFLQDKPTSSKYL